MQVNENAGAAKVWTPANVVTFVRICLVPLFVVVLLSPWPEWLGIADLFSDDVKAFVAVGVFVVISCTDWLDGYLARSRGEVTDLGKFLDPLADKILVAAALIALVELGVIPSWPVLIILTREFIVSGLRMLAASKGVVIAASWYGKAKTVLQILAIVLFIVKYSKDLTNAPGVEFDPLYIVSWLVMIAALVMTVVSMFDYIVKARPLLFPKKGGNAGDEALAAAEGVVREDAPVLPEATEGDIALLAADVVESAKRANVALATAESLTGGGIAQAITAVPGSSSVFKGGFVTYATETKHDVLGVGELLLAEQGPVCKQVALEMAEGATKRIGADIAVAVTGIAGPTGAEPGKPVGTVWVGVCANGIASAACRHFEGNREEVRLQTVSVALETLKGALDEILQDAS